MKSSPEKLARQKEYADKNRELIRQKWKEANQKNAEKRKLDRKLDRVQNKEKYKTADRRSHLGRFRLSIVEYNQLFITQNGCCKICEKHQEDFKIRLCVDHDHETGEVRGLLCSECNLGLGKFKDSYKNLLRAARYLKTSNHAKIKKQTCP